MTDDDLRTVLDRAAGAFSDRPALDGLWAEGRARRRRTRVLGAAAAVAAVVLVVGGVIALATGDDDQGVVAGPGGGGAEEAPPPPEPDDLPITVTVVADHDAKDEEGRPVVEPDGGFTVAFDGAPGSRSPGLAWEAWDGRSWVHQHDLVGIEVLEPGESDTMSSTRELGPEPEPHLAPTRDPGWYRVCATVWAEVDDGRTRPLRPCAQLRVEDTYDVLPSGEELVEPPPEPEQEITLFADTPTIGSGADATVWLAGELDGWFAGLIVTWEEWDGERWQVTHQLSDRIEGDTAASAPEPITEVPPLQIDGAASRATRTLVTPTVDVGWYRICIPVGFPEQPMAPPARELHPCAQIEVVAEGAAGPEQEGDDATWAIDPAAPPAPGSTRVTVLVSRVGCSGGTTGEVLDPRISLEPGRIVITVDAAPETGMHTCPENDVVPVAVELGEAIGDRDLVDGWCQDSNVDAEERRECDPEGEVRWSPP